MSDKKRWTKSEMVFIGQNFVFFTGLTIRHLNEFVQSYFSDGRMIIQIVLYEFVYWGSRVYPKGRGSQVYPNGRGSW